MLTNPKYIGANIYNRRSFKLKHKRINNPVQMWIWRDGAFAPIVEGSDGSSQWDVMCNGQFVSIGWPDVPNLTEELKKDKTTLKKLVSRLIEHQYSTANVTSRKAGEIVDFVQTIKDEDLVLACNGSSVLGIGKVVRPYEYDESLRFPHKRPVEWLSLEPWTLPEIEGPRTSVFPLGKKESNLLEFERRLSQMGEMPPPKPPPFTEVIGEAPLPPLDAFTTRLESILQRKGQVVLYGPPRHWEDFQGLKVCK